MFCKICEKRYEERRMSSKYKDVCFYCQEEVDKTKTILKIFKTIGFNTITGDLELIQ